MSYSATDTAFDNLKEPYVISDGYFYTPSGCQQVVGCPVEISGGSTGTAKSGDNKMFVNQYSDTSSLKTTVGVANRWLQKSGTATDGMPRAGMGEGRRDTEIIHAGSTKMIFVSGAKMPKTKALMDIAPHPSGFVDWRPGLAWLGKCLEPNVPTGEIARVFVNTVMGPNQLNYYEEDITVSGSSGAFTYYPVAVNYITTHTDMAVNKALTWTYTVTQTTGQAYVDKTNKKVFVSLNETASTGTLKVGYWFNMREGAV